MRAYADAAKIKCETLRTDPAIFDVWSTFVVAAQQVTGFAPLLPIGAADIDERETSEGKHLIQKGLTSSVTLPAPGADAKSTQDFLDSCDTFYRAASGRRQANNETL